MSDDENIGPIEMLNHLAGLAADVPGCEHCDAETDLVAAAAGTFGLAVHHDADCPWLAQHVSGPDEMYHTKRHFSMEELAEVKRKLNGDNDDE
ncbi:Mycobacterium numidiamassiliense ORFan [Mycobacterium numidiamassiliense]|uniref:Mycobacterium numidiamassiliense ORFan n=1 Tax=Mycobacterium numidiamassiliense TaxID=1841861 RepID=A0A2U3PHU8_9MYCO|nr:hypothetical protein [Mycobacterium numidiamassiliense]SPM43342.1 Mycobacterium numidiamassiliense ORFan [Mycobacterium numidiamassiliense]